MISGNEKESLLDVKVVGRCDFNAFLREGLTMMPGGDGIRIVLTRSSRSGCNS